MTVGIVLSKHGIGSFKGALCRLGLFVAGLLVVSAAESLPPPCRRSLPLIASASRPSMNVGKRSMWGRNQVRPPRRIGGAPFSATAARTESDNRKGSDGSIYVDPIFRALKMGVLGEKPLARPPTFRVLSQPQRDDRGASDA